MTTTKKPMKPRQRAYFTLGLRHAQRRHRAELRELQDRLDDREAEVGSAAARDEYTEWPDSD